jgi:sugar phosphate isomerase/epimerase
MQIAVQLYTLRDLTKTDFAGIVKQVAQIGYKGVELAGTGNLKTPQEVRKALDDAGLKVCGSHIGIDQLQKDLNKVLDDNDVIGNKAIVIPWIGEQYRSAEGWAKLGKELAGFAQQAGKRGFVVCYHNHDFEFKTYNGKLGFDMIFEGTDPNLVKSELDLFWVKAGGQDPVAYIAKLGKRLHLVHLKDMAAGAERKFAPVGAGIMDYKALIDASNKLGIKWGIVEQDSTYETPPMDAIRTSFQNLKKMGAA